MKQYTKNRFLRPVILAAALLIFLIVVPRICTTAYTMMVINIALIYSLVAYSVSVMLGMGGELSFAGVAFMGGGAFWVANLTTGRLGATLDPVAALLTLLPVFAVISFLFGLILLRLKKTFFSFATIAFVQVAYTFYNNYKPLFGGADGISGVPTLTLFGVKFSDYYTWFPFLLFVSVLCGILVERIRSTQLGRSLASVRDNETAARVLGVNVYMTKVIAFTIAGVLASLAGGLYALQAKFVSSDMFTYDNAAQSIIMAMLGGIQSTVGAFCGALIVQILPQLLRGLQRYFQLFWGISIVLLMIFMPEGLAGLFKTIGRKRRKAKAKAAVTETKEEAN